MASTMTKSLLGAALVGAAIMAAPAHAQTAEAPAAGESPVLRDLDGKNPHVLTPEEIKSFMPGARVARTSARGNTVYWTNDEGGKLFATSDNKSYGSNTRATTTPGTWNITDDGRYCVLINYRAVAAEQWCRFIIKTDDGYYGTTSANVGTSRIFKLDITK